MVELRAVPVCLGQDPDVSSLSSAAAVLPPAPVDLVRMVHCPGCLFFQALAHPSETPCRNSCGFRADAVQPKKRVVLLLISETLPGELLIGSAEYLFQPQTAKAD